MVVLPYLLGYIGYIFVRVYTVLVCSDLLPSTDASFQLSHSVLSCFITYQVAVGGCDGILLPTLSENLCELYQAIASTAAEPKPEESEKSSQQILEDFHSSRTIRRLVLDSPNFASILFKKALSGKCRSWAQGHWLASNHFTHLSILFANKQVLKI